MSFRDLILRAGALGCLALISAGAHAQTSMDRSFKVTSKDCSGVQWDPGALAIYPNLATACRAVEQREGKSYVKFQGTVVRNSGRGQELQIRIKGGDTIKVTPPRDMTVYINDQKTPVSQLSPGDELNFYVPEDRFAAQFAQDTSPTPQYVVVPIIYREVIEYEEPAQSAQARALPATASNAGVLLLLGCGLIALAITLTVWRGRKHLW